MFSFAFHFTEQGKERVVDAAPGRHLACPTRGSVPGTQCFQLDR